MTALTVGWVLAVVGWFLRLMAQICAWLACWINPDLTHFYQAEAGTKIRRPCRGSIPS